MWLVLLSQMILSIIWCEANQQKYLWILRVIFLSLEIIEWVISALLMLFEYRRALGHKWYTHPLFVWSGVFIYSVEIVMQLLEFKAVDTDDDKHYVVIVLVGDFLFVLIALTLGILIAVYPYDFPLMRRDYMMQSQKHLTEGETLGMMNDRHSSEADHTKSRMSTTGNLVDEKKEKPNPILNAKVTSQFSIDHKNLDKIMFEVLTKSNGTLLKSTKRSYTNFRSLDDIINAKYSR